MVGPCRYIKKKEHCSAKRIYITLSALQKSCQGEITSSLCEVPLQVPSACGSEIHQVALLKKE